MEEVISKYKDKKLEYGFLDCHLLVLDFIKYDTTNLIGKYSDYKTGAKLALALTGCRSLVEFLESRGYQKVNPYLVSDGCIVMSGVSCSIYWDGKLFGIWDDVFQFRRVKPSELKDLGVYEYG
ncbi:hypothetical protein RA178_06320 [Shewanella oncorhynchi]|uniref:Uncharacterized protein n=1 Tax=Shewanella oncorhynchi TaxID=2726434 RepID=A0AA50Q6V6_9GAMM|nr:hypothetical protein [Shewanella oncorhynchi]WMB74227.1 hypothetical protein RA178_06320 [Shewanella oncorhynchi]